MSRDGSLQTAFVRSWEVKNFEQIFKKNLSSFWRLKLYLKQQLLKCLVPQALAHSLPQLSQLNATGFVDPNSQIAMPKLRKLLAETFKVSSLLLTKHKHKCKRNRLHGWRTFRTQKSALEWLCFLAIYSIFSGWNPSITSLSHKDLIAVRFEKKLKISFEDSFL